MHARAGVRRPELRRSRLVDEPRAASKLDGFYFPRTVVEADLIVSLPKMKTHHWVGVTASMKNLYGMIPGIKYGWPKNVLHHAGIPRDGVRHQRLAAQDDRHRRWHRLHGRRRPDHGQRRSTMGLVIVGTNPTAVDATVAG